MKYFIIFCFLLYNVTLFSQADDNTVDLSAEYQEILNRFETEFIALGTGAGTCIPAVLVDTTVFNRQTKQRGLIKFGDGLIYQGFYLALLATHYELYPNETKETLRKIDLVLKAINRLDVVAEKTLSASVGTFKKEYNKPNGFFIRDDIDKKTAKRLFKQPFVNSDLISLYDKEKNAVSQDQVIGLLFGYTFLIKALNGNNGSDEKSLLNKTKKQLDVLLTSLKKSKWVVKNPLNKKMVKRGPYAKFQSYPFVEIGEKYLNEDFESPFSIGLGKLSWKISEWGFKWGRRVTIADPFAQKKRYLIYGDVNNSMILKLAAISNTWKPKRLAYASQMGSLELYELVNAYLFSRETLMPKNVIKKMLLNITNNGAYFYSENYKAAGGWASRDRWSHAGDRYNGAVDFKGDYPSLDFLLLYNLYKLCYYE